MALSAADRVLVRALWQRDQAIPAALTKPDFQAAVVAVDDWVDAATTSYVNALPQPFKGATSADQKILLLMYVLLRRMGR